MAPCRFAGQIERELSWLVWASLYRHEYAAHDGYGVACEWHIHRQRNYVSTESATFSVHSVPLPTAGAVIEALVS
jgi:hypothetical protein